MSIAIDNFNFYPYVEGIYAISNRNHTYTAEDTENSFSELVDDLVESKSNTTNTAASQKELFEAWSAASAHNQASIPVLDSVPDTEYQELIEEVMDSYDFPLSKYQSYLLTGEVEAGIQKTDEAMEIASKPDNERTWYITCFSEDGIICKECKPGTMGDILWQLPYNNVSQHEDIMEFLDRFPNDENLPFASDKEFWQDVLSNKIDLDAFYESHKK